MKQIPCFPINYAMITNEYMHRAQLMPPALSSLGVCMVRILGKQKTFVSEQCAYVAWKVFKINLVHKFGYNSVKIQVLSWIQASLGSQCEYGSLKALHNRGTMTLESMVSLFFFVKCRDLWARWNSQVLKNITITIDLLLFHLDSVTPHLHPFFLACRQPWENLWSGQVF